MELYILRHGTTEWNISGLLQGDCDTPLTDDGRQLALETGQALKDVWFDAAVTSPLSRAYETAMLLLGDRLITGDGVIHDTSLTVGDILALKDRETAFPLSTDRRLLEINFGEWEGKRSRGDDPEVTQDQISSFFDMTDRTYRVPGSESLNDIIARAGDFLNECLNRKELEDKRVLISTHGALSRAILHHVWQDNDYWHGTVPPNCSISIIKAKDGRIVSLDADHIFYTRKIRQFYPLDLKPKAEKE